MLASFCSLPSSLDAGVSPGCTGMSQGFNVGASSAGSNVQPPGGSTNILPAGHSGLTNLQRNSSMTQLATASDSHPSPGGGLVSSMGLPASPRSFSSGSLTSLVRHQLLLQQQQQQQQRQPQSVQPQDQLPQSSQQQQQQQQQALQRQELQLQMQRQQQQSQQQMHTRFNLLQQQRLLQQQQQQQLLQSHHLQRSPLQLQQHQNELQQLHQHTTSNLQSTAQAKQPACEPGVCSRRLMQYMYHQRHRPSDNDIGFWREFVSEYFAPHAKKRWCVSLYGSSGRQPTGVFPQDVWQCEICGSKPGRGFETTVEVLPRLCKMKYDSGIIEELLFVDLPNEYRLSSGQLVLEYGKAIQESVFEQLRVVRDGQLRIIFSADLKIMSWEFCARSHEELLPRRLIVPQVTALAAIAQKYQTSANQTGGGLSLQEMQTNCSMFVTSARQLARNLEVPTVNDLGYTKRYVRCLQISEVVNSMKDLIDFSRENSIGPIDSLHSFPRQSSQPSTASLISNQALQQQQQQEQQQQQQHEHLELQSLISDTVPNNSLTSLQQQQQQQLHTGISGHMGNSLSSPIHEPQAGVSNPLTSFFHRSSLTSLQNPLQAGSLLQNSHETNFSNNSLGVVGLHTQQQQYIHQNLQQQQQQQSCSGVGGPRSASCQNSPTNSLPFQNSLTSFSGGAALAGSLSNRNLLASTLQQQNSAGVVGGAVGLLEQQQQPSLQQSGQGSQQQHQETQNAVHHLLQDMMMNQQMNRGTSTFQQGLGVSGLDGNLQGVNTVVGFTGTSMNSFTGGGAGGGGGGGVHGSATPNLGLGSNGVLSNQLAGLNNSTTNVNVQMQQDPSHHQSHHHEQLGVTGLLGDHGLGTASHGFGGIQFNWKTP
ncbi:unnamed protein product [Sphagnum troendelagicum]|uniref:Transcriptional corepressor SEUSS n=1 Tax=Sphagnum troendelagicum TaxID=128251 RepID=A0ABP0TTK0_9BRYO